MLKCALCGRGLEANAAWKGRSDRFYCNGFCAEAEPVECSPVAASKPAVAEQRARA